MLARADVLVVVVLCDGARAHVRAGCRSESAYLEPDQRYGTSKLEAVGKVFGKRHSDDEL